jgi:ADP-ribose pyrophosphatase YjhB (NUDIX family)
VLSLTDIRIATAGVILRHQNTFVFQVGFGKTQDALGVVRVGGHAEPGETLAECARREVQEEASVVPDIVASRRTFTYDVDASDLTLAEEPWELPAPAPLLAVTATVSAVAHDLSVTFLANTSDRPAPAGETQALMFLTRADVIQIASTPITLDAFIAQGGQLAEASQLPRNLPLRPYGQLRALAVLLADDFSGDW